jgi:tetratricopeptide (TPR) repeat protein
MMGTFSKFRKTILRLSSFLQYPSLILALTALLVSTLPVRPAWALPAGLDALPPDIQALYDAGQYRQAAEALQAAAERNPNDASLQYWLGRCFFELRDFSNTIAGLERAVSLDPGRSEYHDWLGRACGRKADQNSHSNMTSALSLARRTHSEFKTAVQLNGTNIQAQRDLIAFIANAPPNLGGGEKHALEQIRAVSTVDPMAGELALADLYAVRKKFDQASEEYQTVLESGSNRIDDNLEVADYYRDRGDSEKMRQAVQAAAKIASSDRRLSYYRGVALVLEKKELEVAEKDLRAYIDTVPDNSELPAHSSAYEWLGKLYENEERPDLAAEQYKAGLTLDPQNKTLKEALKRLQKK